MKQQRRVSCSASFYGSGGCANFLLGLASPSVLSPLTPQGATCVPPHGRRVPSGSALGTGTAEGRVSVFSVTGSFPARQ